MYKAYKFRLYPDDNQKILLNKSFGCSRFVYNYYLSKIKENGYIKAYDNIKDLTKLQEEYPFLKEVDSTILRKELFHLDDNLKRYYNNKEFGFPKYKSRNSKNSYTTSAIYKTYKEKEYQNIEVDLESKEIKLPKLKKVRIRGYRNLTKIEGRIINASIIREAAGKYYVSVLYDIGEKKEKISNPSSVVGVDVGIKKIVTLSNGKEYENNKYIEKYEKKIKRLQRELSRKVKGSNNYYKCKKKINILYTKLKNARKYYLHKITKEITERYDIIVCEGLRVKGMIEKKVISKQIADATFSEIIRQIRYKSEEKRKYFYQINEYYASSQICSRCERKDKKYKRLSEREYKCEVCGIELDRDINASINIMYEGIKKYMKDRYNLV